MHCRRGSLFLSIVHPCAPRNAREEEDEEEEDDQALPPAAAHGAPGLLGTVLLCSRFLQCEPPHAGGGVLAHPQPANAFPAPGVAAFIGSPCETSTALRPERLSSKYLWSSSYP